MPMSTDGKRDMFWSAPWDPDAQAAQCLEQFGVSPREGWAAAEYGGYDSWSQGERGVEPEQMGGVVRCAVFFSRGICLI